MSHTKLYLVTFTVCLAELNAGLFSKWSPVLSVNDFPFEITGKEVFWTLSSLILGTAFGCFLSTFIIDFLGRKISILFMVAPTCLSWLLIAWNPSILNVYVAHFIGGIVSGIIFTSGLTFVTEISPARVRGALCSCFVLMNYCGDLLGCVIGLFATLRTYSYVAMSLAIMQFVMYVWCPETPYYLLRQKRLAAAMDSLIFLRGTGDVTEEMDLIVKAAEFDSRSSRILSSLLHLISESSGGKTAILIGVAVMLVQALSSPIILINFTQKIFEKTHDVKLRIYVNLVLATVCLISYLMCISLVERLGRRSLRIMSVVGVSSCNFFLGIYSFMQENAIDTTNLQSLFFLTIMLYTISVSLGLASVPSIVTNEIFPMYARATCVSFHLCINFTWSFTVLHAWRWIVFQYNIYSFAFWFIAGLNAFSIPFLVFYFPETKRKSVFAD